MQSYEECDKEANMPPGVAARHVRTKESEE